MGVSGYCKIGRRCFLGVNTSLADHVHIAADCFIAVGATVNKKALEPGSFLKGTPAEVAKVSAYRYFKIDPYLSNVE